MSTKNRKSIKIRLILTTVVIVIAAAVWMGPSLLTGTDAKGVVPQFKTQEITKGTFEQTVSSTGSLTAVGTVEVSTQVSGTVSEVLVDYNDKVSEDQILAILDQASFKATVAVSKAAVEKWEAELTQAQAEFNRYLPLFEAGHLSEQESLAYRTTLETTKASLRQAKAELESREIDLQHTVVRSPIDGTVIERSVDAGQTVAASLSSPTLFIIAENLSSMEIEVDVDENDIGMIQAGQAVRFTVPAFVDEEFAGTVQIIHLNPEVISNVVNYTVVVKVDDTRDLLLPGMTATVDFIITRIEDVLLVPTAAFSVAPQRSGEGRSGRPDDADGQKVLLVVTSSGEVQPARATVLADNGYTTAIEKRDGLEAGTLVATGVATVKTTKVTKDEGGIASNLMPKPPRGEGPPR